MSAAETAVPVLGAPLTKADFLTDYRLAWESRHASLAGRKEVFMGKAKFGIFGDGKEVPQLAMARAFQHGDFRAGYYRDQTFMVAIGQLTWQQYFAQLYANPDVEAEPATAGRAMNGHFATRMLDEDGNLTDLAHTKNSSADISPTAGQMPRLLGLAYASKLFRQNPELHQFDTLSTNGNEVAFGTIGNASTSEGMFFEALNAAGVLQVPMLVSVWDDHYGISVPAEYQTTKQSISDIMMPACSARARASRASRFTWCAAGTTPVWWTPTSAPPPCAALSTCPCSSTSRSSRSRRATAPAARTSATRARTACTGRRTTTACTSCASGCWPRATPPSWSSTRWKRPPPPLSKRPARPPGRRSSTPSRPSATRPCGCSTSWWPTPATKTTCTSWSTSSKPTPRPSGPTWCAPCAAPCASGAHEKRSAGRRAIQRHLEQLLAENADRYNSNLFSQSEWAVGNIEEVPATYAADAGMVDGREVLQACFDANFQRDPKIFAIGEDVGKIGDVNQAFAGLQDKFGELRVTDTGIRECTIAGQGIGAALRGLRPIIEIQYLDYLLYAVQILSDDLACLQYRTKGGQKAPLIVRTRGHRLEGVWHSGSPMQMILGSLRGMHVCVPRNMTQAAGFYNTLLRSDEPALVIECLNGYRLKEKTPANVGEFTLPLGRPEVLLAGTDVTVVTYGSMCRIVLDAAKQLAEVGISVEVIDVQTLLPFDTDQLIADSLAKTSRVVFADEDVPGGATAYMMQQVLDGQQAYRFLDAQPRCLAAQPHRPAYSSDGDYFSKPNAEDVFDTVYELMSEAEPERFPEIY